MNPDNGELSQGAIFENEHGTWIIEESRPGEWDSKEREYSIVAIDSDTMHSGESTWLSQEDIGKVDVVAREY